MLNLKSGSVDQKIWKAVFKEQQKAHVIDSSNITIFIIRIDLNSELLQLLMEL